MAAKVTIHARGILSLPAVEFTANAVDHFDLPANTLYEAEGTTIAQIVIDPDDAISGDDQEIELQLMQPPLVITATNASDKFTAASDHNLSLNDEIKLSNTGGALPGGTSAGVTYYVQDVLSATEFKIATTPDAASPIDLLTDGTGTHSFQKYGAIERNYPYGAPVVPVLVMDRRDGAQNDFTTVKFVQLWILPKDKTLNASGTGYLKFGDPSDGPNHFSLPWKINYNASGGDDAKIKPSALLALPYGIPYDADYHLTFKTTAGESNVNVRAIIGLMGN